MRIGQFAEKHGVTQDTIRFYFDKGLLVTKKKGSQYKFSEADSKDLVKIIELKSLGFSLTEIQSILTFQRLSGANTDVFRYYYLSLLEKKKNEVNEELLKFNKLNKFIDGKIQQLKAEESKGKKKLGLPISSLGTLACPTCQRSLSVSNGIIEKDMILDANIHCDCGYKAVIKNGIFIDEITVRTKKLNGRSIPTKEEYMKSSSHTYVNFLYQGMATIIEYINQMQKEPKYIMELGNCVGFFLLQYIKYLPSNSTYILIDYDLERISILKNNLEMYYEHKNFIFLCCELHEMPISHSTVDVMVNFGSIKTFEHSSGEFLPSLLSSLLKGNGRLVGSQFYSNPNSNRRVEISTKAKSYLDRGRIIDMLTSSNFILEDVTDIGPAMAESSYDVLKGKEILQLVYTGKKEKPVYN